VHDFSAPRPRRNVSHNDIASLPFRSVDRSPGNQRRSVAGNGGDSGPWSGQSHRPAFTEDFEEEQFPAAGPHVRKASDLSGLHLPQPPFATEGLAGSDRPKKGQEETALMDSPEITKSNSSPDALLHQEGFFNFDLPPEVPAKDPVSNISGSIQVSPATSPEVPKARPRNVSGASTGESSLLGIPKHMKSNSSRFSFDMVGAAKQEKLLEDRHRKREAEKRSSTPEPESLDVENYEDEDDYDYDNMMDDDGFEERIPGVNADAEDEGFEENVVPPVINITGFNFQNTPEPPSPTSMSNPTNLATPRDSRGDIIGFAISKSPELGSHLSLKDEVSPVSQGLVPDTEQMANQRPSSLDFRGMGSGQVEYEEHNTRVQSAIINSLPPSFTQPPGLDDDDLYFDDGLIDADFDVADGTGFDESVFDREDTDEYGRPLKNMPHIGSPDARDGSTLQADAHEHLETLKNTAGSTGPLAPQPSILHRDDEEEPARPSVGLTHDSLAAYQSALAQAAHKAALSGRFARRNSSPTHQDDVSDQQPGLVADSSHLSEERFSPSYENAYEDDYDDFDYDDALSDDPIIAAANAEALANDPDGFYGQEFGFYSAPLPAAGDAEYANGGYFGPRGIDGLVRSQSGRVAFREPNLTPITERSEYSARNSIMSMTLPSHSLRDSMVSPGLGLADLREMIGPFDEENMSLSALMKARRGAWAGSQASSGDGSPRSVNGDSPRAAVAPWTREHVRNGSALSFRSEPFTMDDPESPSAAKPRPGDRLSMSPVEEEREKRSAAGMGHRRVNSSDSVSYVREDDPITGERWILERRRTGDGGEVEVLGREIVVGGRI
jgi:hypothetical protein